MKPWLAASVIIVLSTTGSNATSLLNGPIRITPEFESFVVESADGRQFLHIDDMLIAVDSGEKSAIYGNTWTAGMVYYQFDANVDDDDGRPLAGDGAGRRAAWRAAAMEWEATVPGLTFVEGTGTGNYILVLSAGGNSSYVGMIGGEQTMNIYNWNIRYIISHEIGHALGLMHEQSRPDRDTYITISLENVIDDKEFNYGIVQGTTTFGNYDYTSVMHYSRCTFADDGWNCSPNFTMDATTAGAAAVGMTEAEANAAMGQRGDLSPTDIQGMRYMYPGTGGLVFSSCFDNGRTNAWSTAVGERVACAHDVCVLGVALDSQCDPCVAQICAIDSYCCGTQWDSICVGYVVTICGGSCD